MEVGVLPIRRVEHGGVGQGASLPTEIAEQSGEKVTSFRSINHMPFQYPQLKEAMLIKSLVIENLKVYLQFLGSLGR